MESRLYAELHFIFMQHSLNLGPRVHKFCIRKHGKYVLMRMQLETTLVTEAVFSS